MTEPLGLPVYNIRVGCTDRGQHPVRFTVRLRREADGSQIISEPGTGTGWAMPRSMFRAEEEARRCWREEHPEEAAAQSAHVEQWLREHPEEAVDDEGGGDHTPENAHVFWCPSCPRTPQIPSEKLWEIADRLAEDGFDFLDVSLLPF